MLAANDQNRHETLIVRYDCWRKKRDYYLSSQNIRLSEEFVFEFNL